MKYFVLFLYCFIAQTNLSAQATFTNAKPSVAETPLVKLRTTLLKNLIEDGQIEETDARVELEFQHNQILLEQKPISFELFEKYNFMLKGLGFSFADRYVVSLKSDYISLRAYG
ncbi:MAG: hypothetical protein AAFP82_15140, partial [Bacteroidota bacterium]